VAVDAVSSPREFQKNRSYKPVFRLSPKNIEINLSSIVQQSPKHKC
jgi:hypothetical protein